MSTIAIARDGKLSLRRELEMHGVPVMEPREVRDIKRGMCESTFFWLLSRIPGPVYFGIFFALFTLAVVCVFGWGALMLQSVAAAGVWLMNGPAYWGIWWPTWAMILGFAVATLVTFGLFAGFLRLTDTNDFIMWFSQRFRGYIDEVEFDMPAGVLNTAFYVQSNLPNVKIDIVYEKRDPFLRFRRGFERVYSYHWD